MTLQAVTKWKSSSSWTSTCDPLSRVTSILVVALFVADFCASDTALTAA